MMSEEFFGVLKKRARENYERDHPFQHYTTGAESAIDATIEALKGMMVGEPIKVRLVHYGGKTFATFCALPSALTNKEIGTDGEEVTVMVFKHD